MTLLIVAIALIVQTIIVVVVFPRTVVGAFALSIATLLCALCFLAMLS